MGTKQNEDGYKYRSGGHTGLKKVKSKYKESQVKLSLVWRLRAGAIGGRIGSTKAHVPSSGSKLDPSLRNRSSTVHSGIVGVNLFPATEERGLFKVTQIHGRLVHCAAQSKHMASLLS